MVLDGSDAQRPILATLFYVLAYLVGISAFAVMARRRGVATDGVAILALAGLLGGALGAQVFELLLGGVPGKSLLGGVAAGYLAVVYAKRRLGIRRPTGDLFAVALAAGEAMGRIGCLFAGCCYGKITTVAWAVHDHGAWRHPTQIYSSLAALGTLVTLVILERRHALPENGLFYVQGLLLCASRFGIEFYRDVPVVLVGLTLAQLACVAGLGFFGWRLAGLYTGDTDVQRHSALDRLTAVSWSDRSVLFGRKRANER
jgi:phosphatidylglycerol:prolipoprotein diacylglycerol transferase